MQRTTLPDTVPIPQNSYIRVPGISIIKNYELLDLVLLDGGSCFSKESIPFQHIRYQCPVCQNIIQKNIPLVGWHLKSHCKQCNNQYSLEVKEFKQQETTPVIANNINV